MDRAIVVNGNIRLQAVYVVAFDPRAALYAVEVSDNGIGGRGGLIEVGTDRDLGTKHKILLGRAVGRRKSHRRAMFKYGRRTIYARSQPQQ